MSRQKVYGAADHEFIVSAMREREAMCDGYDVLATTTIGLCKRPGVLRIRCEAWDKNEEEAEFPLAAYEVEWPNAYTLGFTATLFNAQVRLTRLVADSRAGEVWANERQARGG